MRGARRGGGGEEREEERQAPREGKGVRRLWQQRTMHEAALGWSQQQTAAACVGCWVRDVRCSSTGAAECDATARRQPHGRGAAARERTRCGDVWSGDTQGGGEREACELHTELSVDCALCGWAQRLSFLRSGAFDLR